MTDTTPPTKDVLAAGTARRLVVGIPTASRPGILAETVRYIAHQARLPDLLLLSVSAAEHTGGVEREALPFRIEVLQSPPGLSRQRNLILSQLRPDDLLMFLDDDFLMAPDYLAEVELLFDENPDIALTTGTLVADGILGPGLNHAQGAALLADAIRTPAERRLRPEHTGYGCNMAIRAATVLSADLQFDERLPLYSWLEDVDFSSRLQAHGRLVRPTQLRGVHLGTKSGRTPGKNLGYSQIANPVYLVRKGTMGRSRAWRLIGRHLGANLTGTIRPRPWADYRGRLIGNLTALADLWRGRCDPERILGFDREAVYRDGHWRNKAS